METAWSSRTYLAHEEYGNDSCAKDGAESRNEVITKYKYKKFLKKNQGRNLRTEAESQWRRASKDAGE
jgi:hypothetical protein